MFARKKGWFQDLRGVGIDFMSLKLLSEETVA